MITRETFLALATRSCVQMAGVDRVMLHIDAESSVFLRLNRARLRQATSVGQCRAKLSLVRGRKRIDHEVDLCGRIDEDVARLDVVRAGLAADLDAVPDDPHLMLPMQVQDTDREDGHDADCPSPDALLDAIHAAILDAGSPPLDLVGFHQQGPCVRAFADSRGQRNWHRVSRFHLDWCLYSHADPDAHDKAVKSVLAGERWDADAFVRRFSLARAQLERLSIPTIRLEPGRVRALIAPAAVAELLGGLAWGGFGLKDRRTGTSSLTRLVDGKSTMARQVRLAEATASGGAPAFTSDGFVRPDEVVLIEGGRAAQALVSPRSAAEYGQIANADADEAPHSLSLDAGTLADADALTALDDGILISNFWYLGYSDRPTGRMTGMTRFASFRVEHGRIVAPIGVMRFDNSLLDLFGSRLEALTDTPELIPGGDTWGSRDLGSVRCPGMLVNGLNLTL